MSMLLKYEMRKTWFAKLIVLGVAAAAELAFLAALLFRNASGNTDELIAFSTAALFMTALVGVMAIGFQSILVLHRDMNTKQGYMLFMTPRNCYQILGAKMLENGLSIALAGAFFFLLGLLDVTLLFSRLGQLEMFWKMAKEFLAKLGQEIPLNWDSLLLLVVWFLTSWLATVSVAGLADIVSSALLNGKKYNGIVSFLLFVLLSAVMNWLGQLIVTRGMTVQTVMGIRSAVALGYSAVMYLASAWIMEARVMILSRSVPSSSMRS